MFAVLYVMQYAIAMLVVIIVQILLIILFFAKAVGAPHSCDPFLQMFGGP